MYQVLHNQSFDHVAQDKQVWSALIELHAWLTRWSQWVDATLKSNLTCIENKG